MPPGTHRYGCGSTSLVVYIYEPCVPRSKDWEHIKSALDVLKRINAAIIAAPNPLPILMRAVNSVRARFAIHQPCWRSGRWKSLT